MKVQSMKEPLFRIKVKSILKKVPLQHMLPALVESHPLATLGRL